MADGERLQEAVLKRVRDEMVSSSTSSSTGKRLKHNPELDEPLAPAAPAPAPPLANGVSSSSAATLESPAPIKFEHPGGSSAAAEVLEAGGSGEAEIDEEGIHSDVDEEFSDEETSESDEYEDGYSDDDEGSEGELHFSRSDRKGKGIVIDNGGKGKEKQQEDYKGKGKAIVEDEDSSDDSEAGVEDDEEEFYRRVVAEEDFYHRVIAEDKAELEEVDLNNILPSGTRRRSSAPQKPQPQPQPPAEEPGNASEEEDEDYVA